MSVSITEFWQLLKKSKLVSSDRHRELVQQFASVKGASSLTNPTTIAHWLIAHDVITRYQAKVLLQGRSGPFFIGDYQIIDKISSGRFAGNFQLAHTPSGHSAILIFIGDSKDIDQAELLAAARYVQTAARWIGHPHLQELYQLIDFSGRNCLIVEEVAGETLSEILAKHGRLPFQEVARIGRELLIALGLMHQSLVVHAAIRPDNILLLANGRVKLLQPPLSRRFWATPAHSQLPFLTPEQLKAQVDYLAPEFAIAGQGADFSTDIYACGATLYQMLTARVPFPNDADDTGADVQSKLHRHATEPLQSLEPLGIPSQFTQIVKFAMAKDAAIRYPSAPQLADALAYFIDPRALHNPPPEPSPELRRYYHWLRSQPRIPQQLAESLSISPEQTASASLISQPPISPPITLPQSMTFSPFESRESSITMPVERRSPFAQIEPPPQQQAPHSPPTRSAAESFVSTTEEASQLLPEAPVHASVASTATAQLYRDKKRQKQQITTIIAGMVATVLVMILAVVVISFLTQGSTSETSASVAKSPPSTAIPKQENTTKPGESKLITTTKSPDPADPPSDENNTVEPNPKSVANSATQLVADDGKTLWASPTGGSPMRFDLLPPNAQIFTSVRPAELLAHRSGVRVMQAFGPIANHARKTIERVSGLKLEEISLLQVAWAENSKLELRPFYYVRPVNPTSQEQWIEKLGKPTEESLGEAKIFRGAEFLYYWPASDNGNRLVIGEPELMVEMLKGGVYPSGKIERILEHSDEERLMNLAFSPSALAQSAPQLLPEQTKLLEFVQQAIDYETDAMCVSLHLTNNDFFFEADILAPPDQSLNKGVMHITEKLRQWRNGLDDFNKNIALKSPLEFGKPILYDFPKRVEKFVEFTRVDEERGAIVVRTYLNAEAAEHLVLGTDLALAYAGASIDNFAADEQVANDGTNNAQPTAKNPPAVPNDASIAAKLQQVTSFSFARDSLDHTMVLFGEQLRIPVEILGADLQLEGITKNQSFGLDEKNKTGEEILRTILLKSNPDGKLVYIIKPKTPGGPETLFITTRAAVAKRGDKLPPTLEKAPAKEPAKRPPGKASGKR